MPVYPFKCLECGSTVEIVQSIHLPLPEPECHDTMEQVICTAGIVFARTPGRDTGVYKLDYGVRATEDLTAPGKMERLKKEGRISDPFDSVAPNSLAQNQQELAEGL